MQSTSVEAAPRVVSHGLSINPILKQFVDHEVLPGIDLPPDDFWAGLAELVVEFGSENRRLLGVRDSMQESIDSWHMENANGEEATDRYLRFLEDLGYIEPELDTPFIVPAVHDYEIAEVSAPQLVVPVTNGRYVLNALNARWGSLYDAVYGSDILGEPPAAGRAYESDRGDRVVTWCREFLDSTLPLAGGSHSDVRAYRAAEALQAETSDGQILGLKDPNQFVGFTGDRDEPSSLVFKNHGLHIRLVFDRSHPVGATDRAGVKDLILEAATTVIVDFEDSVATVDCEEKVEAYRNWLGIMKGTLEVDVVKGSDRFTRRLADDFRLTRPDGSPDVLPGRSLALVRIVGMHLVSDSVLDSQGRPIPEEFLDLMVTVASALYDLRKTGVYTNSREDAVYVVKPKLHGSQEVAYFEQVLGRTEKALGIDSGTIRLGVMDEERRTSVNLENCVKMAGSRLAFINTGFLDRTGDEIHTNMNAGPMVRKTEMKSQRWIRAYEQRNVAIGLRAGLSGHAQIGKGMWAKPDRLASMMVQKVEHPRAGANCAWVPSPTAATLHATHYHRVDVAKRQRELANVPPVPLAELLHLPLSAAHLTDSERLAELETNAQSILGYVVRWVDQGVGCSTVPDLDGVGLMEDRATCRISAQHLANWVRHGVATETEIEQVLTRLAAVVDRQNTADPSYRPLCDNLDGPAFVAARNLVLQGETQPNGYVDWILAKGRLERKALDRQASHD